MNNSRHTVKKEVRFLQDSIKAFQEKSGYLVEFVEFV